MKSGQLIDSAITQKVMMTENLATAFSISATIDTQTKSIHHYRKVTSMIKKQSFSLFISATIISGNLAFAKTKANLPLEEIHNFVDVYNTIKTEYVSEQEGKALIDLAIKGMLNGLDPHSIYLKAEELKDFNKASSGNYKGFGIQLEMVSGKLIIVAAIPDSPADKANLLSGDIIAEIDGTVIDNLSMHEAQKLLKDKDTVTLTIMSKRHKTRKVTLTRSTVVLPSIQQKILDNDYGYIRVSQFQAETGEQFEKALAQLLLKDIKGLVLDLRNNPGGLLSSATTIADAFLDAGLIVSTKNNNTDSEEKIHATKNTLAAKLPLVVLINKGSASASELLAGALQNHHRAIIVGQTSFGKGSVQNVIPLGNGDAIKLTTAHYYTPNGTSIQATGITPDIILSELQVEEKDINLLSYSEADITGHLKNPKKNKQSKKVSDKKSNTTNNRKQTVKPSEKVERLSGVALAKSDLQLFEALNVLKVLNLKNH